MPCGHAAMRMPLSHRPGTLHGLDHALPGHADVSEIFFNGLPFAPERSNHRLLTWEDPLGASADLAKSFLSYLTSPRITRYKSTYNIVQYRTIMIGYRFWISAGTFLIVPDHLLNHFFDFLSYFTFPDGGIGEFECEKACTSRLNHDSIWQHYQVLLLALFAHGGRPAVRLQCASQCGGVA